MKRKMMVWMLAGSLLLVNAAPVSGMTQEMPEAQEYLVYMGEETEMSATLNDDLTDEDSLEDTLLQDAGVVCMELTRAEVKELKSEGALVEENIWFEGSFEEEAEEEEIQAIWEVAESEWNRRAAGAEGIPAGAGDGIRVAILDSGVDVTEDIDVAERVSLLDDAGSSYFCEDMTGHGTAVASVIGAKDNESGATGVCPGLSIYAVKMLDEENRAPLDRVAAALQWCIEHDMDIVNMSFGSARHSQILEEMVQKAQEAGMLLVASVGNGSMAEYPAAYQEVVSVGSVDAGLRVEEESASASASELLAPGRHVPVTAQLGRLTVASGSSYAAPHVTAIAAALWSEEPEWSAEKVRALLKAGAKETPDGLVDYAYARSIQEAFSAQYDAMPEEALDERFVNAGVGVEYEMPDYVEANWLGAGHHLLLDNAKSGGGGWTGAYSVDKITVLKQVNTLMDDKNFSGASGGVIVCPSDVVALHARENTNYVATTRYLYEVALAQKNNPSESVANIMSAMGKPYYMTEPEFVSIKKAINVMSNTGSIATVSYESNQAGMNRALRVLGMAIHTAGDAYAHKTMVPNDSVGKKMIKNDTALTEKKKEKLYAAISQNNVTTAALGRMVDDLLNIPNDGKSYGNQRYSDNAGYLDARFSIASQNAVNRLMSGYYSKQPFDFYVFYVIGAYDLKLRKLWTFVLGANGGADPIGLHWWIYSALD